MSSMTHSIAQKKLAVVSDQPHSTTQVLESVVRIDDIPVLFNDTVGLNKETINPGTLERLDSCDIKICLLDMQQVYGNKTNDTIDPAVLQAIDSDTIVLINKRDLVPIRTPAPPAKIRFKNTPLSPQGDVPRTAFRGRVPLRLDGDTKGNTIEYGDFGLRAMYDIRLTERCLQECRATLHRHIKKVKGGRFWIRVQPDHPMSAKPLGVRMGKGKGAFSHWEAKVPNKTILFEIGGGVREDVAKEAFRIVSTHVPGKTEFVVAPKDETVDVMCRRVQQMSRTTPLGVFALSSKTGEGVDAFLTFLSSLLKDK